MSLFDTALFDATVFDAEAVAAPGPVDNVARRERIRKIYGFMDYGEFHPPAGSQSYR